ncbi:MAG: hypothetical protein RL615_477 [Pseudomonadota bacterium]
MCHWALFTLTRLSLKISICAMQHFGAVSTKMLSKTLILIAYKTEAIALATPSIFLLLRAATQIRPVETA